MSATSQLSIADLSFQAIHDGDRGKARNYNGWLHALEQAQWEGRQRYENAEIGRAHKIHPETNGNEKYSDNQSNLLDSEDRRDFPAIADQGRKNSESRSDVASGALRASDFSVAKVSMIGAASFAMPPASSWQEVSRENSDQLSKQNFQITKWNAMRGEAQQWPAQRVHTLFDGVGLHVWVRDANLELGAGMKLLSTFRRQLMETGVSLASLTLNAQPVKFSLYGDR